MGKTKGLFMATREFKEDPYYEEFYKWLMEYQTELFLEQKRKDEALLREKLKNIEYRRSLSFITRIRIFLYNLRSRKSHNNTLDGRET